ncbi:hypothetical protein Godav_018833 [Gossypium davidsonii]|uniref:RNase H type-1 domain-containing protein n=2 Tax=Gossypium TaxID=3633 RepID=A0A7J8QYH1_GOSDV|nr:hypothetical protein [Gossypium davidsonii]MBA0641311.1 hypothetical protein [Gossypium klotzschianum]
MAQLQGRQETLLLEVCCEINLEIGFSASIDTWENVHLLRRNFGASWMGSLLCLIKDIDRRVIIQTDNLAVVQALSNIELEESCITLFRRLHKTMRSERQWQIRYVPREHNIVANRPAKLNLKWKLSLQVFNVDLKEILEVLQQDKLSGLTTG